MIIYDWAKTRISLLLIGALGVCGADDGGAGVGGSGVRGLGV